MFPWKYHNTDAWKAQGVISHNEDIDKTSDKAMNEFLARPELQDLPPSYTSQDLVAGFFPPSWVFYHHQGHVKSCDHHIGVQKEQPMFNVSFHWTWKLKTGLTLTRHGQRESLAELRSEKIMTKQAVTTIHSSNFEGEVRCQSSLKTTIYSFIVPVPNESGASQPGKFEWRVTHGKEARE